MNIAIIANDKKKELITEFCMAYCGILSRHSLCATATTCKYITEATRLEVEKLFSGSHGGIQQIAAKVAYDEIDILIILRDPSDDSEYIGSEVTLMQACDKQNVPVATNIASAEALILALDRGDLDWRTLMRDKRIKRERKR